VNGGADLIERFLKRRVVRGAMPGAVWRIDFPQAASTSGVVGTLGADGTERVTAATRYDLASLTKPICTALLAVLLERDGRFDLTARIDRWLPEFAGSPYATCTAVELLTHRSGMPAWRPLYLRADDEGGYLRQIASEPPLASDGAELYSDLGYMALGVALQRAAGASLAELFARRVAMPLALRQTAFGAEGGANVAPTEQGNGYEVRLVGASGAHHAWRERIPPGQVHDANAFGLGGVAGHAGLFGTADEVARIALELLSGERLGLDGRSRRRLLSAATPRGHRTLGWQLAAGSRAARGVLPADAPGHVGFTGTSLWIDPHRGRVYTFLSNRVHPQVRDIDFQWIRRAFHRLATRRGAAAG